MTSESITNSNERNTKISQATRAGQITLAVKEHGRGSDFILTNQSVIANGGMAVIDAFIPETEADQRQHQGRAARQGQDGTFGMVLKQSEITEKFGLTADQINQARNKGELYAVISEARNKKFSEGYQRLIEEEPEMVENVHNPSMELLENVRNQSGTREEVVDAHKKTLPNSVQVHQQHEAKVLILFDSTASMGGLINALKTTLVNVVNTLDAILQEHQCKFELQFAHYEDYYSGPDRALRTTKEWSCDAKHLSQFIQAVKPWGGGPNKSECVELGLYHANQLAQELIDKKDGTKLNHVILIGDEPPSPPDEMKKLRNHHKSSNTQGAFFNAKHYKAEIQHLKEKHVPVSTFFVRTQNFTQFKDSSGRHQTEVDFKYMADETGGEAGELHLNDRTRALGEISSLFGRKIIHEVAQGNADLENQMISKYMSRMQQFSR